jgi:hypothetical protein
LAGARSATPYGVKETTSERPTKAEKIDGSLGDIASGAECFELAQIEGFEFEVRTAGMSSLASIFYKAEKSYYTT